MSPSSYGARGLPMPAAVVVFSPASDPTSSGRSMTTKHSVDPLFTREALIQVGTREVLLSDSVTLATASKSSTST